MRPVGLGRHPVGMVGLAFMWAVISWESWLYAGQRTRRGVVAFIVLLLWSVAILVAGFVFELDAMPECGSAVFKVSQPGGIHAAVTALCWPLPFVAAAIRFRGKPWVVVATVATAAATAAAYLAYTVPPDPICW